MTSYLVTVSFGHKVELKFYATKDYLDKFRKKIKKDEKFEMKFSDEVLVTINPDFIQAVLTVKSEDQPSPELKKTGMEFIEMHTS
ncbi:hypothetical protein [Heyndrickxia sporothermodurans]|uniref:hypothetical protein n=1 Tax=Heyndrickxia sporothermodurans TaxID=46224 RepID=UPI000D3AB0C0|nr:hypothetical protein [Heyndrickxia sporothermodurans]PTY92965.1 hypothetical protein B5V90_02475 [Heyndrickxia sporothermodurans]